MSCSRLSHDSTVSTVLAQRLGAQAPPASGNIVRAGPRRGRQRRPRRHPFAARPRRGVRRAWSARWLSSSRRFRASAMACSTWSSCAFSVSSLSEPSSSWRRSDSSRSISTASVPPVEVVEAGVDRELLQHAEPRRAAPCARVRAGRSRRPSAGCAPAARPRPSPAPRSWRRWTSPARSWCGRRCGYGRPSRAGRRPT